METKDTSTMSVKYPNSELAMDDRSNHNGSKERLGLSFTIDYLLFDRGARRTKEEATGSHATEQAENNTHQKPKLGEVEIHEEIQGKRLQQSDSGKSKACDEEGDEEQHEVGEEEMTTTIISTSRSAEKTADKPNQSYIALISKAILESDEKKLLLCDIYQWIMDHYPYFKNKVCSLQSFNVVLFMGHEDIHVYRTVKQNQSCRYER